MGQTTLPTVSAYASIGSTEWKSLANGITNLGIHQESVLATLPPYNVGDLVEYVAALQTNLSTLTTNSGATGSQGTTEITDTSSNSIWYDNMTITQTIAFPTADAARYFFNAGGQIVLLPTFIAGSNSIGSIFFSSLSKLCGTWVISGLGGKIVGSNYTPFTKIGGENVSIPNYDTTLGYYGLSTSYQQAVKIYSDGTIPGGTGYGNYGAGSYIQLNLMTNGTQGGNSDNGTIITAQTVFAEIPTGLPITGTAKVSCIIKYPSNGYMVNTWNNVTVNGYVSGS